MLNYLQKSRLVLGRGERDLKYVKVPLFEKGRRVPDNKLKTKKLLKKNEIPVPKTYKIIRNQKNLENLRWSKLPNSFVIKPNTGTLGRGILIVFGKRKKGETRKLKTKRWIQADGSPVTINDIKNHVLKILEGTFSLARLPDVAFFEERLKVHPDLKPYCKRGIPDVRIIIYNKIPVMAELRLPTPESKGRANLHQGGIGLGIDMGTGITTAHGIWHKNLIYHLPGDKKFPLAGIKIPHWKKMLELAVKAQIALNINYLGLDVAIDREQGPMIVEINTRPMLGIQTANLAPLRPRLEKAEGIKVKTIKQAVRLAQDLFGGQIEEELEEISGRKVIGATQPIEIINRKKQKISFIAKIDTGTIKSRIKQSTAEKINLKQNKKAEKPTVFLTFIMDDISIETEALLIDEKESKYEIIIGRKDLKKFLVDPSKIYLKSKKIVRKKS